MNIIFDVDGTLWDSTGLVAQSWNDAIADTTSLNRQLSAKEITPLFGKPVDEIFAILFPTLAGTELETLRKNCLEYENIAIRTSDCPAYDDVETVIKALAQNHKLFIVSNCMAGYIEGFLENKNLEKCITDFTCPDYTNMYKSENIKLIMQRNNLEDAVYVGDTLLDFESCNKISIPMIFASYGFGKVPDAAVTISSFAELLDINYDVFIQTK